MINFKKGLALIVFFIIATIDGLHAQEVGVRYGQMAANQVAIDIAAATGGYGQVHSCISLGEKGVGFDALFDFYQGTFNKQNGLSWYAGAGGASYFIDDMRVGAAVELGFQYDFMHDPFSIGFDWRPTYWLINESVADDFQYYSFGINLRYSFDR